MVQENSLKNKVIVIAGPTAVGKSDFALKLAKKINGEIISCDSMQIYRDLNIGTSKVIDTQGITHHLIDIVNPNETFSVKQFQSFAFQAIKEILKRGKTPILVGGTGLYINSVIYNYNFVEDDEIAKKREELNKILTDKGKEFLFDLLIEKDYESSLKLHVNDTKRVMRALEKVEFSSQKPTNNIDYDFEIFVINDDRETLYNRINLRVDRMFEEGLEDEVSNVMQKYKLSRESQSMQGIGYKEFFDYFENKISLEELKDKIKQNSRHYAKRQLTWFRKIKEAKWVDCKKLPEILLQLNI